MTSVSDVYLNHFDYLQPKGGSKGEARLAKGTSPQIGLTVKKNYTANGQRVRLWGRAWLTARIMR